MSLKPDFTRPQTQSQPLQLSAWSQTTTFAEKVSYWNNRPYRDTPKSRWEAHRVSNVRRSALKAVAS